MKIRLTIFYTIIFFSFSYGQTSQSRTILGVEYAKRELKNALADKEEKQIFIDTLISDKESAISISETILFRIYGKENIVRQRPYEIYRINEYWILNGTLPTGKLGGSFLIILKSTNGEIIRLRHGK